MQNKQLRERIDGVWSLLKGLKAAEIQHQIEMTKNIVQTLIGANEIQKTRNSSLLKLFTYELIIFADQKSRDRDIPTTRKTIEFSRISERQGSPLSCVKELKKMLAAINSRNKVSLAETRLDINQFRDILKKVNSIQEQLLKEEKRKKKTISDNSQDQEGMELVYVSLLKKKQKTIQQLNNQLQQNFDDKQQLQQEIEELKQQNLQLQEEMQRQTQECQKLKEQLQKYKNRQKDQLIIGASEFMNTSLKNKHLDYIPQVSVVINDECYNGDTEDMSHSTRMLSKYFNNEDKIVLKKDQEIDQKTVKKAPANIMKKQQLEQAQQQNLLQSLRIYKSHIPQPPQPEFQNNDYMLQKMLLIQATFIEKLIEGVMN